jgi:PadR family transcriptional regulator, regulatory protein PadR
MVPTSEEQLGELRKGALAYCVLARLSSESSYGLKLAADLAQFRHLFTSEGAIYPLLARLRKQGWVETEWVESTQGPPRRYYKVTTEGRDALATFATTWENFSSDIQKCIEEN